VKKRFLAERIGAFPRAAGCGAPASGTEQSQHAVEIRARDRFNFGDNWARFLATLSEQRIQSAIESLQSMLGRPTLEELSFLDVGSGSGLFSLAARRLGARVVSFDFDPQSVACTAELRHRYMTGDTGWRVESGSVLDKEYLQRLGTFDVVYSWGVLHHTGNLRRALDNVALSVKSGGMLFIALYNDQGWISRYWTAVKRRYNQGSVSRVALTALHAPWLIGVRAGARALTGRLQLERGMSLWYDMVDWLGGWPFEVARPDDIVAFYGARGFEPRRLRTVGKRAGCNEFVFQRVHGR
jgi:2-polyprenyl-3-methyl-5-hydroxy-6-metoxy-1,4-benzoquinol methylase